MPLKQTNIGDGMKDDQGFEKAMTLERGDQTPSVEAELIHDFDIIDTKEDDDGMDSYTRAEIDIAISTAKRYPRSLKSFRANVLTLATLDQETAGSCYYSLQRDGKLIQGPSIRLAEIAVTAWGNIRAGARILGEAKDGKSVSALGVVHDLENNVLVSIESRRRITRSNGRKYSDDMIAVTANAAAAVAYRNAVLKVIPGALLKPIFRECLKVAAGDLKTLGQRRKEVFARLFAMNPALDEKRVLNAVSKPSLEDVGVDEVAHLIGLGTAVRDRLQDIEEAFPPPRVGVAELTAKAGNGKA